MNTKNSEHIKKKSIVLFLYLNFISTYNPVMNVIIPPNPIKGDSWPVGPWNKNPNLHEEYKSSVKCGNDTTCCDKTWA